MNVFKCVVKAATVFWVIVKVLLGSSKDGVSIFKCVSNAATVFFARWFQRWCEYFLNVFLMLLQYSGSLLRRR